MRRDTSFCAKSVRDNIFTNGAPYLYLIYCCNLSGGVVLIVWFNTTEMCVKNNTIVYVARASNSKRDCEHDLCCCLLPRCEALCTCRSAFPIATVSCNGRHLTPVCLWLRTKVSKTHGIYEVLFHGNCVMIRHTVGEICDSSRWKIIRLNFEYIPNRSKNRCDDLVVVTLWLLYHFWYLQIY